MLYSMTESIQNKPDFLSEDEIRERQQTERWNPTEAGILWRILVTLSLLFASGTYLKDNSADQHIFPKQSLTIRTP